MVVPGAQIYRRKFLRKICREHLIAAYQCAGGIIVPFGLKYFIARDDAELAYYPVWWTMYSLLVIGRFPQAARG